MVDVTDRKHAEQEARQIRDELAHAGRIATMGEMAAALAHELNQPLAAILSNAQAATRFLSAANPDLDEVRDILHDIVDDDARAGEVIRRIRSLVKKGPTDLRPLDLNTILKEVIGLLHSDAVIRGIVVLHELEPDLPKILGDRIQLQQVAPQPSPERVRCDARWSSAGSGRDRAQPTRRLGGYGHGERPRSRAFLQKTWTGSSSRSGAPNPAAWAWGCRSAARSSRATADACGPRTMPRRGATFGFSLPIHVDAALSVCPA